MKILFIFLLAALTVSDATYFQRCPKGWTGFGRKCYIYITDARPWAEAERYCQLLGGNLASVHNKHELAVLRKIKWRYGASQRTWIGAHDAVQNSLWLWSDGSLFDFSAWHTGEPNNHGGMENCVEMNYKGGALWNDAMCSISLNFLCQKLANTKYNCKHK